MTRWLAARRRKRLTAKLNRAWWKTTWLAIKQIHDYDHHGWPWHDLSEDLWFVIESLEAGDPVDAPFVPDDARGSQIAYKRAGLPRTR